jgi:hypothetical protein
MLYFVKTYIAYERKIKIMFWNDQKKICLFLSVYLHNIVTNGMQ